MTEYVVDFGDEKSSAFVRLAMAQAEANGARLCEEIVRCRDCKLCDERYGRMLCRRDMSCDEIAIDVKLDGYCAWGERREDQ